MAMTRAMGSLLLGLSACALAATAAAEVPSPERPVTDPRSVESSRNVDAPALSAEELLSLPAVADFAWGADDKEVFVSSNLSGRFNIWKMAAGGGWPVRLTQSEEAQSGLRALPDGKTLLFLQDRGGDENYDIYAVPTAGGTPVNLTATPDVAEAGLKVSPDGKMVAMTYKPKANAQRDIAVMDLATRAVRVLTQEKDPRGYWSVAAWSGDGRTLIANREITLLGGDSSVWKIDVASGRQTRLIADRANARDFASGITVDGSGILVTSNFESTQLRAGLFDVATRRYRWFSASPWEQVALGMSPDRRSLLYRTWEDGRTVLSLVDTASLRERRLDLPVGVNLPVGYSDAEPFSHDSRRLALSHTAGDTPTDVRIFDTASGEGTILVRSAPPKLGPGSLPASHIVTYRSFDGTLVSGVLTMPFNLRRDGTNPALGVPHGGPTAASDDQFDARAAFLASRGYIVFQPNYRGSTGYGLPFMHAERHDMGGGDMKDVVASKDFLVATGYVDPDRVGITGGSAGGWLTMLALGKHPGVFKAGVQIVGIIDWETFMQRTDPVLGAYVISLMGPRSDKAAYASASPITYLDRIEVPLLSLQGRNDIRVPAQQAEQVHAALQARGTVSEMVMYENEGHGFLKRENQIDELNRTVGWFDRYLTGVGRQ